MLEDTIPLLQVLNATRTGLAKESLKAFIGFMEEQLGGRFVINTETIPYRRDDLIPLLAIATELRNADVIKNFYSFSKYADEPLPHNWVVECATPDTHRAGGMSTDSDESALVAALAESLERYLWFMETDFYKDPLIESSTSLTARRVPHIDLKRFVGFTDEQRTLNPRLTITPYSIFHWISGYSWTTKHDIHLPSQLVSAAHGSRKNDEPWIRTPITTGLATWPTRTGALLGGTMEILERDAFMITWLNQLSLPRLQIDDIAKQRPSLARLIERCRRYGLTPQATRLLTDAPTYAVCASVTDEKSGVLKYMIGLKSHRDIARAVEGALLEALRMRQTTRTMRELDGSWERTKDPKEINHLERTLYWTEPEHAERMQFLTGIPSVDTLESGVWEFDTDEMHFDRIVHWAREKKYEIASVSLGVSKKNVTPWYVEMVVMPELQPMHQNERYPYLDGVRLTDIPAQFGYQARGTPFSDLPHPFA